jgi:hypothetical protein
MYMVSWKTRDLYLHLSREPKTADTLTYHTSLPKNLRRSCKSGKVGGLLSRTTVRLRHSQQTTVGVVSTSSYIPLSHASRLKS